jgi:serine/threonine-protein kinase
MGEKIAQGDVLAGKYRVETVLGSGGMGVVVAATHLQLDVLVAIKFMSDEAFGDRDLVARFLREARAAARLRSEHVARVMDVGTLESGVPYLVMEYLEGTDLSALLSSDGLQPVPTAVEYIVQACEALDEAHAAGIVHRDIKPSNLFRTRRPNGTACIKVLDFGISKADLLSSTSTKLAATRPHTVLGSPLYMAPEQMRAPREVDARADIWALGATLYELLTGRVPFEAESLLELALRVAQGQPRPLRSLRPETPWALERVVLRCLQKDREERFPTAHALAAALAPFALRARAALPGLLSGGERSEDPSTDSNGEADTRVDRPLPRAGTTLPIPVEVQGSLPPVARHAHPSSRTGARESWARSLKLVKGSQIAGSVAVLVLGGAAVVILIRTSGPSKHPVEMTSVRAAAGPAPPAPPSGVAVDAFARAAPAPSASAEGHIPTISLTDLRATPPPSPMPPALKPAATVAPASVPAPSARPDCLTPYYVDERGIEKLKVECLEANPYSSGSLPDGGLKAR